MSDSRQTDNLNPANAALHANVPAFIPGQPYGYGYGYDDPSAYGEEGATDADNEAETEDNHQKDRLQSLTNSKDCDNKGQYRFVEPLQVLCCDETFGITG